MNTYNDAEYVCTCEMEVCAIHGEEIELPTALIENEDIFRSVLSYETWENVLTEEEKGNLTQFLPKSVKDEKDKEVVVRSLFDGQNFKFGNPLEDFRKKLRAGYFTPEVRHYHVICQNAKKREFQERLRNYYKKLLIKVLKSRQDLAERVRALAPDQPVKKKARKCFQDDRTERIEREYNSILRDCFKECNCTDSDCNEDENSLTKGASSNGATKADIFVGRDGDISYSMEESYGRMLYKQKIKNRVCSGKQKPNISLAEVFMRAYPSYKVDDLNGIIPAIKEKNTKRKKLLKISTYQDVHNRAPITKVCRNFFALLREIFRNLPDKKGNMKKIEEMVTSWKKSVNTDSNQWLIESDDWAELVGSALRYLAADAGAVSSIAPLSNFVPYVDFRDRMQQWKWIGSNRDSDEELEPLCSHWFNTREEEMVINDPLSNPPLPRSQTEYIVKPSSDNDKEIFRKQECERYSNPHRAYTYRMHGYDSVVGPVKGVYDKNISASSKAREHILLKPDRPAFVTILSLARDAAARLPNGEGTRAEICELLRDSQYIVECSDSQINSVVSGALDRLHYEKDPCVKYDSSRKLWVYLHRNRSEDEFERLHKAQAAAFQAKKGILKPKAAKLQKSTAETSRKNDSSNSPSPNAQPDKKTGTSKGETANNSIDEKHFSGLTTSATKTKSVNNNHASSLIVKSAVSSGETKIKLILGNVKKGESKKSGRKRKEEDRQSSNVSSEATEEEAEDSDIVSQNESEEEFNDDDYDAVLDEECDD